MTLKIVEESCVVVSRLEVRSIMEAALAARAVPFPETADYFGFCDTPDGLRLVWEVRRVESTAEAKKPCLTTPVPPASC